MKSEKHVQADAHIYASIYSYRMDGLTREEALKRVERIYRCYGKDPKSDERSVPGEHRLPEKKDQVRSNVVVAHGKEPPNQPALVPDNAKPRQRETKTKSKKARRKNKRNTPVKEFDLFGE